MEHRRLARLLCAPECPALIDVRIDEDFKADPRFIPGAMQRPYESVGGWATEFSGQATVVICQKGQKLSQWTASWLRHDGAISAWVEFGLSIVPAAKLPSRDPKGRPVWVARKPPKS